MNEKQGNIYLVITAILSVPKIEEFHRDSEILYGVLNYIAKYSLANEKYFVTKASLAHLRNRMFLNKDGLRRGKKSIKNGFTYEHPIPSNVVADYLFKYRKDEKTIKYILSKSDVVTVLTRKENEKLSALYNSKMPVGWCIFKDSPFQRYLDSGIVKNEPTDKIPVYGAIAR